MGKPPLPLGLEKLWRVVAAAVEASLHLPLLLLCMWEAKKPPSELGALTLAREVQSVVDAREHWVEELLLNFQRAASTPAAAARVPSVSAATLHSFVAEPLPPWRMLLSFLHTFVLQLVFDLPLQQSPAAQLRLRVRTACRTGRLHPTFSYLAKRAFVSFGLEFAHALAQLAYLPNIAAPLLASLLLGLETFSVLVSLLVIVSCAATLLAKLLHLGFVHLLASFAAAESQVEAAASGARGAAGALLPHVACTHFAKQPQLLPAAQMHALVAVPAAAKG